MKRLKIPILAFFLINLLGLNTKISACTPASPYPLYSIDVTYNENLLPSGLNINKGDGERVAAIMSNSSDAPIYLVELANLNTDTPYPNPDEIYDKYIPL